MLWVEGQIGKGGLTIGISPFQRALIRAVLERYQVKRDDPPVAQDAAPELCLWIDWSAKRISQTERPGFQRLVYASLAQRAAVIDDLREKHVTVLP